MICAESCCKLVVANKRQATTTKTNERQTCKLKAKPFHGDKSEQVSSKETDGERERQWNGVTNKRKLGVGDKQVEQIGVTRTILTQATI